MPTMLETLRWPLLGALLAGPTMAQEKADLDAMQRVRTEALRHGHLGDARAGLSKDGEPSPAAAHEQRSVCTRAPSQTTGRTTAAATSKGRRVSSLSTIRPSEPWTGERAPLGLGVPAMGVSPARIAPISAASACESRHLPWHAGGTDAAACGDSGVTSGMPHGSSDGRLALQPSSSQCWPLASAETRQSSV